MPQAANSLYTSQSPSARGCSAFQRELTALIPHLRAFSRMLCGTKETAEDIAQEALTKAWRSQASFQSGTNMKACVFTIARNEYYSRRRRAWREMTWDDNLGKRIAAPAREQEWAMDLSDTASALRELPASQREALILVGVGCFTYEDAARICATRVGTVKSRVARARTAMLAILDGKKMPPRGSRPRMNGTDDILAQLSALSARKHL